MVKLVHINKVGMSGDLYVVREFHQATDPGYGGGIPANPVFPNNSLPATPPTSIGPGETLVLVRDPEGVWHYAALSTGSPPPRPVQPLPTPPTYPDNALPPTAAPKK